MRTKQPDSELKTVVAEAWKALTLLDADRLEDLARWCDCLNEASCSQSRDELAKQAREAEQEAAILARVLDATRANLDVMKRLRELYAGNLEYTEPALRSLVAGNCDGLD